MNNDGFANWNRYAQLAIASGIRAAKLPKAIVCDGCGAFLHAITNGQEVVVGSFRTEIEINGGVTFGDDLVSVHRPRDRRVSIDCGCCGKETNWFRSRN